jgi:hypothetical protein
MYMFNVVPGLRDLPEGRLVRYTCTIPKLITWSTRSWKVPLASVTPEGTRRVTLI